MTIETVTYFLIAAVLLNAILIFRIQKRQRELTESVAWLVSAVSKAQHSVNQAMEESKKHNYVRQMASPTEARAQDIINKLEDFWGIVSKIPVPEKKPGKKRVVKKVQANKEKKELKNKDARKWQK